MQPHIPRKQVPSLRRRHQLARTSPLLYVPSLADVNNMLAYGMHVHIVATPFHWFICHVPCPCPATELTWDMQVVRMLASCPAGYLQPARPPARLKCTYHPPAHMHTPTHPAHA